MLNSWNLNIKVLTMDLIWDRIVLTSKHSQHMVFLSLVIMQID
jgi:hypothetical protein